MIICCKLADDVTIHVTGILLTVNAKMLKCQNDSVKYIIALLIV